MSEKLIFDHYEVLTREDGSPFELGRGAMGITYKAVDTNLKLTVALKVIRSSFLENELAQQRFVREARAAAQLRHPNVASVFHLGTSSGVFFYAMEFVDGETVESFIRRKGPIDPVVALRITLQVTRALAAAAKHQLVHRDIKPANLMLIKEDDDFLVKVIDFGLAKSIKHEADDDLATLSMGGFVGTAHFASPEQLEEKEIDVRSDIYSLGVTLWYMLAGQAPFGGSLAQVMSQHLHKPPPLEKLRDFPESVRTLVGRMIEKNPQKRPQSPAELRADLENCLAQLQTETATHIENAPTMVDQPLPVATNPVRRRGLVPVAIGMFVLLAAVAGTFVFLEMKPSEQKQARSVMPPIPTIIPHPVPPSPPPVPVQKPAELTRASLAPAEQAEAAQDWAGAMSAYVQLQKQFPKSDVPRVRLELLLGKFQSEKGAIADDNFNKMREPLTEAAKLGVASAMEMLGHDLRKRDPKASFAWLCSAAASGRATAMTEVGLHYSNGTGVERDFLKAAQWFDQARTAGDTAAGTLLAECYLFGKGVSKNESKAVTLLRNAVSSNEPRAMDQLANCYHKGLGVNRDDAEAFRLYSQAAKLGYLDSNGNLGVLYLTSDATDLGKNETARTNSAIRLFREGARGNNAFCMYLYARCLEAGTGVAANPTEASEWYRRAAEGGNRSAQEWCRQHQVAFDTDLTP